MYPIYTYLYVRSLAFAFEVLKAIGMRRKRVVSAAAAAAAGLGPVSYTHLTLPTILRV